MSQYRNMDYRNNNSCCNCNRNTCCENRCNCGCPCHRPCPDPMPPIYDEALIGQLIGSENQASITQGTTKYVKFATASGDINVPVNNPLIKCTHDSDEIIFNKAGSYLITYQVVAKFTFGVATDAAEAIEDTATVVGASVSKNYTIQLYKDNTAVPGSKASIELITGSIGTPSFPVIGTQIPITRTTLVSVKHGDKIKLGSLLSTGLSGWRVELKDITLIIEEQ